MFRDHCKIVREAKMYLAEFDSTLLLSRFSTAVQQLLSTFTQIHAVLTRSS